MEVTMAWIISNATGSHRSARLPSLASRQPLW
jgi:hypothetical protein